MDKETKAAWVEALRSGKYEQTQGGLKRHGGYCCLGVLCEIKNVPVKDYSPMGGATLFDFGNEQRYGFPPNGFCGLRQGEMQTLSGMNDNGKSFEYIADYIERTL